MLKQERSFRVVLKNMHYSSDLDSIKEELTKGGHIVTNIWNIKQRGTKKALSMFYVELKPDPNNKLIYNIKHLLQCKIQFEPPHPRREIVQCASAMVTQKVFVIEGQDV